MATLVEIAAQIVASHASSTPMTSDQLIFEIGKVHNALKNLEAGQLVEGAEEVKTALTVKEAFKKGEVICMVCGKGGFKTLARHLSTAHSMKPGEYKKQFGIAAKQPLSARNYSEARRKMALERGLADNLAKAREVRMANIEAKKVVPAKQVKGAKLAEAETAPKAAKAEKAPKAARAEKAPRVARAPKAEKAPKVAKLEKAAKVAKVAKPRVAKTKLEA